MQYLAPRNLPPLALILDDLGNPTSHALAAFLDVNRRTAALALFWLTRWGRGAIDATANNDARMFAGLAECYRQDLAQLRAEHMKLLALADFGCANSPSFQYGATAYSFEPSASSCAQTSNFFVATVYFSAAMNCTQSSPASIVQRLFGSDLEGG
jgi:hypothetical protein